MKVGKPAVVANTEMEERVRERKAAKRRAAFLGGEAAGGVGGGGRVVAGSAPVRNNFNTNATASSSRSQPQQQSQAGPSRPRSSLPNTYFSSPSSSSSSNGPQTPSSPRKAPPPAATGPQSWSCVQCTFKNKPHLGECEMCMTPRPAAKEVYEGGWVCDWCGG